ncbi:phage tail protein [Emticicia agri]|uniref:Peptidase S74 domain-containing protein n=1 Tax=Emticicia agri TaxID=2492393 RepID=A0A4Q5LV37_9BACT|nr:phage tail protein [Emticicia agri]RYU93581.1 hypothetical protein EWM59_21275 [Emticicia agri]
MDQILIYKPDGESEAINSNSQVSVITQAEHKKTLLGEDIITMTVESATVRNFAIGDYIQVFGLPKYKINQLPKVTKESERKYIYELVFEGLQYDMLRVIYRNTDIVNFNNSADFTLIGTIEVFLNVLIHNLNRVFGTDKWALGDFPEETQTKNLLFNNENCLAVLQRLCEEYQYQFACQQTEIQNILHIRQAGTELEYNFKYGQGKGLYKLDRVNVDTKNLVNTLWAYGSSKNLPADYKGYSPRLRISIDEDLPLLDSTSRGLYGIFEGSVVFEDIYPHRTGTVSVINAENRLQFSDASMNFDLNAKEGDNTLYLLAGTTAKVRFQTGNLAGYEFEVSDYNHTTKTFTLLVNQDQKGLQLPSSTEPAFQIEVGDTYVILDIMMPQAYINAAEEELLVKATEYLDNNSVPTVKYTLELDEFYIRDTATNLNVFDVGDSVNIEDTALGINSRIQIIEFTRDILRPYKYSLTIKDVPQVSTLRTIIVQNHYNRDFLKLFGLDDPAKAKNDKKSSAEILNEILPRVKKILKMFDIEIGQPDSEIDIKGKVKITTEDFGIQNPGLGKDIFKVDTGGNTVIGADETFTKIVGGFGLENESNFVGNFSVADITADHTYTLPDYNAVLNDWDYFTNIPDIFPPSPHTHAISDITGLQTALNNKQPLDADLTAIAAFTGTGFPKRTGTNTWAISEDISLNTGAKIYLGGELFIHNYNNFTPSANTFVGINSGNLALNMEENDGIDNGIKNGLNMYGGNTALGYYSMNGLIDGGYSVAIGQSAMRYGESNYSTVAVGTQALMYAKNTDYNTAIGQDAGKFIGGLVGGGTTGTPNYGGPDDSNNTLIGAKAGLYLKGGINTYIGTHAGELNIGSYNIGLGLEVLQNNAGSYNIAIGRRAMLNNTANSNIALGDSSVYTNTSGNGLIGLGVQALYANTTGSRNLAMGVQALYANTTGSDNIAIGNQAAYANIGGSNVFIGSNAAKATTGTSESIFIGHNAGLTGNYGGSNVIIGPGAGSNSNITSGINNLFLGKSAGNYETTNVSNRLNIGMTGIGPLISGNFSTNRVGINTLSGNLTHTLTVNGSIYAKGITPLVLDSTIGYFQNSIVATISGSMADLLFTPGQASSGYVFQSKNSAGTAINAIAINRDGNVGLGIGNAVRKLHIYDASNASALVQSGAIAAYRLSGTTQGSIINEVSNLYITNTAATGFIHLQTNSVSRLAILADGKIGINQPSPTYQLDVNGTFRVAGASQFDAIASCPIAPTSANHLVNKAYVDSLALVKRGDNVYTIATSNITLSGLQTINGYAVGNAEPVLVAGQNTPSQNGVYIASVGAWTRSTTADSDTEIRGAYHYILFGTYANYRYINTNTSAITLGSTSITYDVDFGAETDPVFSAFATANNLDPTHIANWNTAYSWDNHATQGYVVGTSRTITINGTSGRVSVTGGAQDLGGNRTWTVDLIASGVTAGDYTKVTVDTYGRVTAGTNPTTLAGYGITDAITAVTAAATYQPLLDDGTGLVKSTAGVITYDNSVYLTETLADSIYLRLDDTGDFIDPLNAVLLESNVGERGFFLYGIEDDNAKRHKEAFFFVNPDEGVLGIHAYRQEDTVTKTFGLEMYKDGYLYHLKDDLTKHRILTTSDLSNLTWNGGQITNDINMDSYVNLYWGKVSTFDFDARIYGYKAQTNGERGLYVQTHKFNMTAREGIFLGSSKRPGGTGNDDKAIVLDNVIIDLQGVNLLVGGYARFAVSISGDYHKLTLVVD